MNLSIHQYRVTPLRNSSEFHLRAGHGTRHDLFLPSLYPLRCSTRKVVSGGEFLNSASASQKVSKLENCLARLASHCSFEPLSLSSFTVSVCREVYTNHYRTSSSFFKNFAFFEAIRSRGLFRYTVPQIRGTVHRGI